jgi:hypothetical protein
MAEQQNTQAITPVDGEYLIQVSEFNAAGKKTELSVALPNNTDFHHWSLMQRTIMLKKGPWAGSNIYDIAYAITYADNLGLDIMRGDVFPTGAGRIGISNKAKIKMAQGTGNIEGIEVKMEPLTNQVGATGLKDIACEVTIHVKGWKVPIVRKARLSQWYNDKNPNWKQRPEHMLELNTVAHACEYVPGAAGVTEEDEAPPQEAAKEIVKAAVQAASKKVEGE